MARKRDKQPPKTKKYFRSTKSGAGMTRAGVAKYRRDNPGSKLKTAVTGKVKPGSKSAKRRKSFCARSAGQMKKFPKAAKKGRKITKKKSKGGAKPKNAALYARVKAEAKRKFKVYPSAYANAWLVRTYKKRGGTYA